MISQRTLEDVVETIDEWKDQLNIGLLDEDLYDLLVKLSKVKGNQSFALSMFELAKAYHEKMEQE
jgi:hypothetical protein